MSTSKEALKFTYKGNSTSAKKLQMIYKIHTPIFKCSRQKLFKIKYILVNFQIDYSALKFSKVH